MWKEVIVVVGGVVDSGLVTIRCVRKNGGWRFCGHLASKKLLSGR